MPATEERLITLETKLSFQEYLIHDLNDALTQQQQQIDVLQHQLKNLRGQLTSELSDDIKSVSEEVPPPHY